MGYLASSRTQGNCNFHLFTCAWVVAAQGWTMRRHVKASIHFLLSTVLPHTGAAALPPSSSALHCSPKVVIWGHTASTPLAPEPIQPSTSAISFCPLCTYLDTSAIRPRHTARLWELTKLLPVNWFPANLLLGSSWLCESSYPAAQLFHRGRYGWTRTPVQRQLHEQQGYCLDIGSWSLLPPRIIWSVSHTSSGAHISAWFGGLGIHEPVKLVEICSSLMCVCGGRGACTVKWYCFLFASFLGQRLLPMTFIGLSHNGMLILVDLRGATDTIRNPSRSVKGNWDISFGGNSLTDVSECGTWHWICWLSIMASQKVICCDIIKCDWRVLMWYKLKCCRKMHSQTHMGVKPKALFLTPSCQIFDLDNYRFATNALLSSVTTLNLPNWQIH